MSALRLDTPKTCIIAAFAAAFISFSNGAFGELPSDDNIDFSRFTDPNLKNCVAEQQTSKISQLTHLNCYGDNIGDASGIEQLTALTALYLSSNQLQTIDLSGNIALTTLYLDNNLLTTLDLTANTQLTHLAAKDNRLSTIDLSENIHLITVNLFRNALKSIDVSSSTDLLFLLIFENELTAIDVSANTELLELNVGANQLSEIDLSNNTKLYEFVAYDNQLTTLDVSATTYLFELIVRNNKLTEIYLPDQANFYYLDLSGNEILCSDLPPSAAASWSSSCVQSVEPPKLHLSLNYDVIEGASGTPLIIDLNKYNGGGSVTQWTLSEQQLPNWLSFNNQTGELKVASDSTPVVGLNIYEFDITAKNRGGESDMTIFLAAYTPANSFVSVYIFEH